MTEQVFCSYCRNFYSIRYSRNKQYKALHGEGKCERGPKRKFVSTRRWLSVGILTDVKKNLSGWMAITDYRGMK